MYAVIVSLPLRYLTYSAWISGGERRRRTAEDGASMSANAIAVATTTRPTFAAMRRLAPTFAVLVPIRHPPDLPTHVVAHQQRAIRSHNDAHRTAPARPVGPLPSGDEIVDRDGAAVLYVDAHHLVARGHRAIPGTVEGHEGIAAIVRREGGARVKVHSERC